MRKILNIYKNLSLPLKATFWFTVCNVLQKGIMFLAVPIYTRIMPSEQYGIYTVILSWLDIFEIIATFRIGWGGYVVGLTKYSSDRSGYTSSMQCLSIVITTVVLIFYLILSNQINAITNLDTITTLMIFGLLYFMPAVQFWSVRKRVDYKYISYVVLTVITSIFTLGFGTIFALSFENKATAVIGARLIVTGVIGVFLIWINCKDKFTFFNKNYWKRALTFNVPLIPYYLSMVLLNSSDKIIINAIVGATEAGIYGVAYTASKCMQIFTSAINQAFQPWLFDKMKKDDVSNIPNIINLTLIFVAILNLLLIAFAPEVIMFIAPKQYSEAIWVIPPLAASVFVMYFYQNFVNVEFYFEESKMTSVASIGAAILNIVLNIFLIPVFGYLVAGYTTLISYLIFAFAHYIFMRYICKKRQYNRKIVDIKSMSGIMILFLIFASILMVGYKFTFIRYLFILIILIICILRRKQIINLINTLRK